MPPRTQGGSHSTGAADRLSRTGYGWRAIERCDLARLVESRSIVTVLVTHAVDEAIALADRIFVLSVRPAHVVGEIKVVSPRAAMSVEERKTVAARIEALRESA